MWNVIESFCHSLITKQWKNNQFVLLQLREFIEAITTSIPSLYSYLFCIHLFYPSNPLSSSYLFYSVDKIPKILIGDLQYSLETENLSLLCNQQEELYTSLLGYYFYFILCQVSL